MLPRGRHGGEEIPAMEVRTSHVKGKELCVIGVERRVTWRNDAG